MPEKQHRIYPPLLARAREFRRPQTPAETKIWVRLRNRELGGFKFRRQHPIDRFVADFCCLECRLVVEIDGDSHLAHAEYDVARTRWLNYNGYEVIRFTNQEVHQQLEAVLESILRACLARKLSDPPSP
jgi:very-short-patch-repair endonuclease